MTLPHDNYLKFIDNNVYEETLFFHSQGNYTISKETQHFTALHHISQSTLEKMTGNELILNPFPSTALSPPKIPNLPKSHTLHRNDSCELFQPKLLSFQDVLKLLSPLLKKHNSQHRRGYPSGGAIYPIEVFCFDMNNQISDWPHPNQVLHLLANSRSLEPYNPKINAEQLKHALIPENFNIGSPALALIYCTYLPKALFKYRYRGYRLAHMEAGSMYMLTDLRCKELLLESRLWSGFTDYKVTQLLQLNPTLFLPTCIQFIG